MTRKQHLETLLTKIEAGEWNTYTQVLPSGMPDICRSYSGSLDAAMKLHEPVVVEINHRMKAVCVGDNEPMLGSLEHDEAWTLGTTTTTKVDGKLTRILWEAGE